MTGTDPWAALFDLAVADRGPHEPDLVPFWLYEIEGGARVERRVPLLPCSREVKQLARLRRGDVFGGLSERPLCPGWVGDRVRNPYFKELANMLAKITSKNQLTLPKSITNELGPVEYFEVEIRNGQVILTPVRIQRADAVRAKLAELGLTEKDVTDAIDWVRETPPGGRARRKND